MDISTSFYNILTPNPSKQIKEGEVENGRRGGRRASSEGPRRGQDARRAKADLGVAERGAKDATKPERFPNRTLRNVSLRMGGG